jgi:2'-5' RNA ligase
MMELNSPLVMHPGLSLKRGDERPIYLMIKPPPRTARVICERRRAAGIDGGSYGPERVHITLLPIGDARYLPASWLEALREAIASFQAEPFNITFERIRHNALRGGRGLGAVRDFQDRLVRHLIASGFPPPDYDFDPHLTLTYVDRQERNVVIPPIGWRAEELLLIKSIHGQGRHELLDRWPLIARQGSLGF